MNQMRGAQRENPHDLDIGPRDMEVLRFIGEEGLLGSPSKG